MRKYNRSDKWGTKKGKALGTKAPGTWFDFFLHRTRGRQRDGESEREISRLYRTILRVIPEGLGGIMTVLVSAPIEKMDYTSSLCLNRNTELRRALGMTVRGQQALSRHDRGRPTRKITSGSHLLWMCLLSCVNVYPLKAQQWTEGEWGRTTGNIN